MPTPLDLATEAAVTVAALTAGAGLDHVTAQTLRLEQRGASAAQMREAVFVASLFCGFPRGVAALVAMQGLASDQCHAQPPPATREAARAAGEAIFRTVHLANADRQLAMLERAHPDYADTVLREAYGRVLARPFLSLVERELVGVACLTVQMLPRQLRAHLLAARNVGATFDVIAASVALAAELGRVDPAIALTELAKTSPRED